jgi:hypothetical protein
MEVSLGFGDPASVDEGIVFAAMRQKRWLGYTYGMGGRVNIPYGRPIGQPAGSASLIAPA